jgi:hypothetical protein
MRADGEAQMRITPPGVKAFGPSRVAKIRPEKKCKEVV